MRTGPFSMGFSMATVIPAPMRPGDIREDYLSLTRRRRMYSGIILVVFAALFISGFRIAEMRNAGSFADGFSRILDFPRELVVEAWEKAGNLPGHAAKAFPALVETFNIAMVSTLLGCLAGTLLALRGTRGLARWPRLVPVARRSLICAARCPRS